MRYEPAAAHPDATGCQSGTRALQVAIYAVYPELAGRQDVYGCWNPRKIAGSSAWSLHSEGRALDIGVPVGAKQLGWELSCELSIHRTTYGVQRVIWDGHIWSIEQVKGWRELSASTLNKHHDHIHIEQYWATALKPGTVEQTFESALRAARTLPATR